MMDAYEGKKRAAIAIAIEAEVLVKCDLHPDTVWDSGQDIGRAYELGNAQLTAGTIEFKFKSRSEMMDIIKEVVGDVGFKCLDCENLLAD